ncbi:MAG: type II toxin-antitoxin system VapB family antitoxin [Pseudomonadota bacterium]
MTRSTIFKNNRSQAVRLPKQVAFPDDVHQVEIITIGQSRVISPVGRRWDDLFRAGPRATDDFMTERDEPPVEVRESL